MWYLQPQSMCSHFQLMVAQCMFASGRTRAFMRLLAVVNYMGQILEFLRRRLRARAACQGRYGDFGVHQANLAAQVTNPSASSTLGITIYFPPLLLISGLST